MYSLIGKLDVDSYKLSHFLQTASRITNISSYIEPRGGLPKVGPNPEIVNFGLQGWIDQNLTGYVQKAEVEYFEMLGRAHGLPVNVEGLRSLIDRPLPLRIQALPEGTVVKPGIPMLQVTTTTREHAWLTSFVETSLLRGIWYPSTVASNSRRIKKVIKKWLLKTADSLEGLPFKLHDFGFRGVSSYESGCIGGTAHLVNFKGTDTMGALLYARAHYGEEMAGFSVPAAEHSTITSWGRAHEAAAYANMVDKFGGEGKLYAVVSDSYDIYNACDVIWGQTLREKVGEAGGTLVVRPDSGDPQVVIPRILDILGERFGTTLNQKGYRMLNPCVRVIQGDGVNERMIDNLLGKMALHGWSADNIAFGMGGALLQDVTRDDYMFAMKASAVSEDGGETWEGICKDPVGSSWKRSKAGRLDVVRDGSGELVCVEESPESREVSELVDVWVDGDLKVRTTLAEVRERAEVA